MLLVLIGAAVHAPVLAGTLEVQGSAASVGQSGLKVSVGAACVEDDVAVPGPSVNTDQLACNTITAGDVEVTAPGALFLAGGSVHLQPGFAVAPGVPFTAHTDPFVATPLAYLEDRSPDGEATYNARFDLRPDSITLISGEDIGQLNGYSADGTLQFQIVLRRVGVQDRLAILARDNLGGIVEHTSTLQLANGFNHIQISWIAGFGNGRFTASVNGAPMQGLTTLNNGVDRIDFVRWGLVDGNLVSTTGFIELDDFMSWR